jgi:hypothetical protein
MSVIKLVQGDNRPYIKMTLTNADGTVVDVSSSSTIVQVLFRQAGTTTILSTITCTKPNGGADGVVQFNFPGTTLNVTAGSYEGEIQITFGTEVQTVYDTLKFFVRQQF